MSIGRSGWATLVVLFGGLGLTALFVLASPAASTQLEGKTFVPQSDSEVLEQVPQRWNRIDAGIERPGSP